MRRTKLMHMSLGSYTLVIDRLIAHRLNSVEARRRMDSYRIGRIEGRWENFTPPIQGGKFRKLGNEAIDRTEQSIDISEDGSGQSTPEYEFRKRKFDLPTPPSSVSSAEFEAEKPRMSLLDVKTHEEINLDLAKYPPLDPEVQDEIVRKYRQLNERVKAENLYQCNYWAYLPEVMRYALLFCMSMYLLKLGWYKTSALFLGLFWHQLVFTAHDAGHMGITHNFHIDTCIGIFIADFCGGLSIGWWKRNHSVHHIVTNSPEHDPDIEHMPFIAISTRFFNSLRSTYYDRVMEFDAVAKWAISKQHWLYYPLLTLGRFNLYRLSWEYLLLGQAPRRGPAWWHRHLELLANLGFWLWFGYFTVYLSIPTA